MNIFLAKLALPFIALFGIFQAPAEIKELKEQVILQQETIQDLQKELTLGGYTRFPNSDVIAKSFNATSGSIGVGTTTPYAPLSVVGKGGIVMESFNATGTIATSTITNALQLGTTAGDNALKLQAGRIYPSSNSVGGMVNLANGTTNTGPALVVYTNIGATSAGNLVNFRCDNVAMVHDCVKIDHDGAGDGIAIAATAAASNAISASNSGIDHTITAAYTGSTANKGAINMTSTNTSGSMLQGAGAGAAGLGLVKFTVNAAGFDTDSAMLSLDASVANYTGQGIFVNSSGGGWSGKILNLRANGTEYLTMRTTGAFGIGSTTPYATFSVATSTANATTSVEFGKAGQNKGTCFVAYDTAGAVVYGVILNGGTSITWSTTNCKGAGGS